MKSLVVISFACLSLLTSCADRNQEVEIDPWFMAKVENGQLTVTGDWPANLEPIMPHALESLYPNGVALDISRSESWQAGSAILDVLEQLSDAENATMLAYGQTVSVISDEGWNQARDMISLMVSNPNIAYASPNVFWYDSLRFPMTAENCQVLFDHHSFIWPDYDPSRDLKTDSVISSVVKRCGQPVTISIYPRAQQTHPSAVIEAQPWLALFEATVTDSELSQSQLPAPLGHRVESGQGAIRFELPPTPQ